MPSLLCAAALALLQSALPGQEPRLEAPPRLDGLGLEKAGLGEAERAAIEDSLRRGDYDRAAPLLLQAVDRHPRSPELLRLLGGVLFVRNEPLGAAIAFKKAEALAPLDERSRFTLVLAYVAMGRRDWARPELAKLEQAAPRDPRYVYWTARLDYDDGRYASAVEGQRRALALDPLFVRAHDNLGLAYEALGRNDEARGSYEEAVRLNRLAPAPSPWPPLNLGLLLTRQDRKAEAEPLLREAVRTNPRFAPGRYQLGLLLEKTDRAEDARAELEAAASLDPAYPEPQYALARLYRRAGESAKADQALERFQALKKNKGPAGPGR